MSVRPAAQEPGFAVAAIVVVFAVGLAVLKPWAGGDPTPAIRPDPGFATPFQAAPVATADRSATGLARPVCLGTGGWRVASLERWHDGDVRVWRAIEPIETAAGPLDVDIPSVPVTADTVTGLGWCAPAYGPEQPTGPAQVQTWLVDGGRVTLLGLRQVQPLDGTTPIAALYEPLRGAWASGRVVFRYEDVGTGQVRWFAADLEVRGSPTPSAPAATPAPRGTPAHGPGWSQGGPGSG